MACWTVLYRYDVMVPYIAPMFKYLHIVVYCSFIYWLHPPLNIAADSHSGQLSELPSPLPGLTRVQFLANSMSTIIEAMFNYGSCRTFFIILLRIHQLQPTQPWQPRRYFEMSWAPTPANYCVLEKPRPLSSSFAGASRSVDCSGCRNDGLVSSMC